MEDPRDHAIRMEQAAGKVRAMVSRQMAADHRRSLSLMPPVTVTLLPKPGTVKLPTMAELIQDMKNWEVVDRSPVKVTQAQMEVLKREIQKAEIRKGHYPRGDLMPHPLLGTRILVEE